MSFILTKKKVEDAKNQNELQVKREREMCMKNEVPSVPHSSSCLEKREILTVSEFDEIRHDS